MFFIVPNNTVFHSKAVCIKFSCVSIIFEYFLFLSSIPFSKTIWAALAVLGSSVALEKKLRKGSLRAWVSISISADGAIDRLQSSILGGSGRVGMELGMRVGVGLTLVWCAGSVLSFDLWCLSTEWLHLIIHRMIIFSIFCGSSNNLHRAEGMTMMMMSAMSQRPIHDPIAVPWLVGGGDKGAGPHHSCSRDDNCAFHSLSQIDGEWKLSCWNDSSIVSLPIFRAVSAAFGN